MVARVMDLVRDVNLERVLWCCRDRGLRLVDLASAANLNQARLEAIARSESFFSVKELQSVARFFDRGILFFLEQGPVDERKLRTNGFRTLTNEFPRLDPDTKALIERVERQREVFIGLRDEDEGDAPRFSYPKIDPADVTGSAAIVRNWLGIRIENSFATYRAAIERKGVLVFRSNGYAGKWQVPGESEICGFAIAHDVLPIIFVRKQESESRQLFTLIHELAHLVLHRSSFADEHDDLRYRFTGKGREFEANSFAGNFLVPFDELKLVELSAKPSVVSAFDEWLRPFARARGISVEVVLRRLMDIGEISREKYREYRKWKANAPHDRKGRGSREYRHREPLHLFGGMYVRTVLDALHSRQITLNKASSYLDNIKVADIHKLERFVNETF